MEDSIQHNTSTPIQTATFGNGCFWCTEAIFEMVKGVLSVTSGYAGGTMPDPDYAAVCTGLSGHAECVQIRFNAQLISYANLLQIFWLTHDPTTLNRQGNDVGTQYRSVIFYHSPDQKLIAEKCLLAYEQSGVYQAPIVTSLEPFTTFYPAENNHQRYFELHRKAPYCQFVIRPKLEKFLKDGHAFIAKH